MRLILHGNLQTSALLKRIAVASQHGYNEFNADAVEEQREQQELLEQQNHSDDDDDDSNNSIVSTGSNSSMSSSIGFRDDEDGYDDLDDNSIICSDEEHNPFSNSSSSSSQRPTSLWLVVEPEESQEALISTSSSNSNFRAENKITTLHLIDWNFGLIDNDVIVALQDYLEYETTYRVGGEFDDASSSSSSSSSQLREVILEDCIGGEYLQHFVVVLFETVAKRHNSTITIRYTKQRKMPPSIANGLYQGATEHGADHHIISTTNTIRCDSGHSITHGDCRLRSLRLEGMILTPLTTRMLHVAIPLLRPYLRELSIRGNVQHFDMDNNKSSIIGRYRPDMKQVVNGLRDIVHRLSSSSCLQILDLENCHLPDQFLADLLEAVDPTTIESLLLRGNIIREESQQMIHDILTHRGCMLKHLDASSHQLPQLANYRILRIVPLADSTDVIGSGKRRSTSFESLDVPHNRQLLEYDLQLSIVMQKSTTMQHCRISDRGISVFDSSIPHLLPQFKTFRIDGSQSMQHDKLAHRHFFQTSLRTFKHQLALPPPCKSKTFNWIVELDHAGHRTLLLPQDQSNEEPETTTMTNQYISSTKPSERTNQVPINLWPIILERADRQGRDAPELEQDVDHTYQSFVKGSCEEISASNNYTLIRETGHEACLAGANHGKNAPAAISLKLRGDGDVENNNRTTLANMQPALCSTVHKADRRECFRATTKISQQASPAA